LVLDTVTRGRREMKLIAYLEQPPPAEERGRRTDEEAQVHRAGRGDALRAPVRTYDIGLASAIQALLDAAHIRHLVRDLNRGVLEGSIGILPRRVLVDDEHAPAARRLLEDAGLGHELRPGAKEPGEAETTVDAVLAGRLHLRQPRRG